MSQKPKFVPGGMEDEVSESRCSIYFGEFDKACEWFRQEDSDDYECDYARTLQNNIRKTTENLKMTIVPDITENATLNGTSFDATLHPDVAQWVAVLQETWNKCNLRRLSNSISGVNGYSILADKKGAIITNMLQQFYGTRPNPYVDGLKLYANCSGSNHSKTNTLSYIGRLSADQVEEGGN